MRLLSLLCLLSLSLLLSSVSVSGTADNAKVTLAQFDAFVAETQAQLASLKVADSKLSDLIAALQARDEKQAKQLADLEARADKLAKIVDLLQAHDALTDSAVAALQAKDVALLERVAALESQGVATAKSLADLHTADADTNGLIVGLREQHQADFHQLANQIAGHTNRIGGLTDALSLPVQVRYNVAIGASAVSCLPLGAGWTRTGCACVGVGVNACAIVAGPADGCAAQCSNSLGDCGVWAYCAKKLP